MLFIGLRGNVLYSVVMGNVVYMVMGNIVYMVVMGHVVYRVRGRGDLRKALQPHT